VPDKQKNAKKTREHKVSKHTGRGAKRNPQTPLALILMDKGLAHKTKRRR
jgi:hypothetical protein